MTNIFRYLLYEEKPLSAFSIEEEGTMDFCYLRGPYGNGPMGM